MADAARASWAKKSDLTHRSLAPFRPKQVREEKPSFVADRVVVVFAVVVVVVVVADTVVVVVVIVVVVFAVGVVVVVVVVIVESSLSRS